MAGLTDASGPARSDDGRPRPLPAVRDDLVALTGYHPPQVDVSVRLNTNESPFPPPEGWLREFQAELADVDFNRYPDRHAGRLRSALAEAHQVEPSQVFCANGSNEVLQCLLLAYGGPGRSAALFEPTYTMHGQIARTTGTAVAAGRRTDDFRLDLGEVSRVLGEAKPVLTFLCSPNNPTGMAEPPATVDAVLALAPGLVVVDEAYGQFARSTALDLVRSGAASADRIVVVRTFSKTWSMAGVRLGYLVASPEVVAACELVALPYHLDVVKQLAGRVALRFGDQMERRISVLTEERGRIASALAGLPVETWPSEANFLLFRPVARDAGAVWSGLVARSVLVRDCSTWPGLTGCLRVTVGLPGENDRFLEALSEVLR